MFGWGEITGVFPWWKNYFGIKKKGITYEKMFGLGGITGVFHDGNIFLMSKMGIINLVLQKIWSSTCNSKYSLLSFDLVTNGN